MLVYIAACVYGAWTGIFHDWLIALFVTLCFLAGAFLAQRRRQRHIGAACPCPHADHPSFLHVPPPPPATASPSQPAGDHAHLASVPRGAIRLPGTLAGGPEQRHWARFKADAIARCGGPLAFALACEVPLDQSTVEYRSGDHVLVRVGRVLGPDGAEYRGEFALHSWNARQDTDDGDATAKESASSGDDNEKEKDDGGDDGTPMPIKPYDNDTVPSLHGYGIVRAPNGTVYEGEFVWGNRNGMFRVSAESMISLRHYTDDYINGTVYWASAQGEGFYDTWLPTGLTDAPDTRGCVRTLLMNGCRVSSEVDGRWRLDGWCGRRWDNGDVAHESWERGEIIGVVRFIIAPTPDWPGFVDGAVIDGCEWRIEKHEPTDECPYDGHTYVPADVTSPQFDTMARYVLSRRSCARGFEPAQQAAFERAVKAALSAASP